MGSSQCISVYTFLAHRSKCHAKGCLTVFTGSSRPQTQRALSFSAQGLAGGHISEPGPESLLYYCTLWVSLTKSRIPNVWSHCSFQWPDATQIVSMLLSDDNSRSVLIRGAVCSVNDVVIRVPKTEHSFGGHLARFLLSSRYCFKKGSRVKRTYLCDHFHFRTQIFKKMVVLIKSTYSVWALQTEKSNIWCQYGNW